MCAKQIAPDSACSPGAPWMSSLAAASQQLVSMPHAIVVRCSSCSVLKLRCGCLLLMCCMPAMLLTSCVNMSFARCLLRRSKHPRMSRVDIAESVVLQVQDHDAAQPVANPVASTAAARQQGGLQPSIRSC